MPLPVPAVPSPVYRAIHPPSLFKTPPNVSSTLRTGLGLCFLCKMHQIIIHNAALCTCSCSSCCSCSPLSACQSCQGCCCGRTLVLIMAVPLCKVSTRAATTNLNRTQWQLLQRCSCICFLSLLSSPSLSLFRSLSLSLSLCAVCLSWQTFVLTGKKGEYALKFMPRRRDIKFSHRFSPSLPLPLTFPSYALSCPLPSLSVYTLMTMPDNVGNSG